MEEGGWREEGRGRRGGKQGEKERREMNKHLTGRRNTMTMCVFSNYWTVMHNDITTRVKHLGIVVRVLFLLDKHNHYLARQTGGVTPVPGATHVQPTRPLSSYFCGPVNRFL